MVPRDSGSGNKKADGDLDRYHTRTERSCVLSESPFFFSFVLHSKDNQSTSVKKGFTNFIETVV